MQENGASVEKQVEKGKKAFAGPELAGKTLGVVGLGAIGLMVANAGVALGMNVLGYDPYISIDNAWKLSRAVTRADPRRGAGKIRLCDRAHAADGRDARRD